MPGRSGSPLPVGKVPHRVLESLLSAAWSYRRPATRVGPAVGEDAAIITLGGLDLVFHIDPITEAGMLAGWLSVHVASNDVAASGARPRWVSVAVLAPKGFDSESIASIQADIERAARSIGVEVVGGHTEVSPGVSKPIVVAAGAGVTCSGCAVPTGGARPGDLILQVKPAGMEGTAIIATDFRHLLDERGVDSSVVERAAAMAGSVSIVREAVELAENRLVTSMHDPTEGGLLGGLVEMALASRASFRVYREKVIIREETVIIAEALGIDPLRLISSGSLLATVPRDLKADVEHALEGLGVEYSFIGEVERGEPGVRLYKPGGAKEEYKEPPVDEISKLWGGAGEG